MSAYARSRQIPVSSVMSALKSGRIRRESDGKIDPKKADADWIANTKARVDGRVPVPPPRELRELTANELAEACGASLRI
jgi:hypothetical protein